MKFVYLYGPPATWKLTVANELSNLTNLKVFHNHLTVDLIKPFLGFGSKDFFELSTNIRLQIFEAAAKMNIPGLIFTSCYSYPQDNGMVKKMINRVTKYWWDIYFIHLYADIDELKRRVKEDSRKNYGKVKTEEWLQNSLEKWNMFTPIPFVESLEINNTNLSPKEVAKKIKDYCKL